MYTIQDEALIAQLEEKAGWYGMTLEEMLRAIVDRPSHWLPAPTHLPESRTEEWAVVSEGPKAVYRKAFDRARRYWVEHGEAEKAALSDEKLYEEFGVFDKEGIPRLKSELPWDWHHPPVGSGPYMARLARLYAINLTPVESEDESDAPASDAEPAERLVSPMRRPNA
jgi:hypothetical protein